MRRMQEKDPKPEIVASYLGMLSYGNAHGLSRHTKSTFIERNSDIMFV